MILSPNLLKDLNQNYYFLLESLPETYNAHAITNINRKWLKIHQNKLLFLVYVDYNLMDGVNLWSYTLLCSMDSSILSKDHTRQKHICKTKKLTFYRSQIEPAYTVSLT